MGQTPAPTKPMQTSKSTQEATEEEDEPACKLEPESTQKGSGSPQTMALDEMTAAAR